MKITRRLFVAFLLIAPLVLSVAAGSAEKPAASRKYLVLVGTYTTKTESKGIYAYEFDADTGKLTPKGVAVETSDPSWVAVHPNGKYAYAANEAGKASTVSAFSLDAKNGKLTLLNRMLALGEDPCHISFDEKGKYVLVANYTSGNVVLFPILGDGRLGKQTAVTKDFGTHGPNKERQEGPHAHWIAPSPNNRFLLVADLGLDEILTYAFDPANGMFSGPDATFVEGQLPAVGDPAPPHVNLKPGSGPRHAAFHPNGEFLFVVSELSSVVTTLQYDAHAGALKELQSVSMLPSDFSGRNDAAEIAVHPNGKLLYASNRGHDSIAVFAIDEARGTLTFVARVPTGGKEPRHFAIDPTGKYLLAENQFSNNIVVFKIDLATGGLTPTGQVVDVPSPVDLTFVPATVER